MAQDRFTIAFDKNDIEQELYQWIKEKAIILGPSKFVKQLLYDHMIEEKQQQKNN